MRKEAKVIMLPTDQASNIQKVGDTLIYYTEPTKAQLGCYLSQHLYLTSDEEIKEGDWFLNRWWSKENDYYVNSIKKLHRNRESDTQGYCVYDEETYNEYHLMPDECFKIIATTDKSLTIRASREDKIVNPEVYEKPLAQIPQSFIEAYVKAEGKIDKVMVEYRDVLSCSKGDNCPKHTGSGEQCLGTLSETQKLILREDNTVSIHKIKEEMYTREQVVELIKKCNTDFLINPESDWDKWIEENL